MYNRCKLLGLNNAVTFVDATDTSSNLVNYYIHNCCNWYNTETQLRKDAACYASHIKALRLFLETSDANACVICEDDILFHNNFLTLFQNILDNLPSDTPLVTLAWMISGPVDQTVVNSYFWKIDPENVWGAQCYYITREYAMDAIDKFDRKFNSLVLTYDLDKVTSEIIIRKSGGYMVTVPLVIEDCIDSDRAPQDLPYHEKHWCYWDYNNYDASDFDYQSPLIELSVNSCWTGYPFKLDPDLHAKQYHNNKNANTSDTDELSNSNNSDNLSSSSSGGHL
jgi:hypothetical protein